MEEHKEREDTHFGIHQHQKKQESAQGIKQPKNVTLGNPK